MKAEAWLLERRDARQRQQIITGSQYKDDRVPCSLSLARRKNVLHTWSLQLPDMLYTLYQSCALPLSYKLSASWERGSLFQQGQRLALQVVSQSVLLKKEKSTWQHHPPINR